MAEKPGSLENDPVAMFGNTLLVVVDGVMVILLLRSKSLPSPNDMSTETSDAPVISSETPSDTPLYFLLRRHTLTEQDSGE